MFDSYYWWHFLHGFWREVNKVNKLILSEKWNIFMERVLNLLQNNPIQHLPMATSQRTTWVEARKQAHLVLSGSAVYLVATAVDGAAAPRCLGLGCVPSRKPLWNLRLTTFMWRRRPVPVVRRRRDFSDHCKTKGGTDYESSSLQPEMLKDLL